MSTSNRVVSLWDMLRINADWFISAMNNIAFCEGALEADCGIAQGTSNRTVENLRELVKHLPPADVPATIAAANLAANAWCKEGGVAKVRLRALLESVISNFTAELKSRELWILSAEENRNYRIRKKPYGSGVFEAFPDMRDDLEEACICLALGRSTATIFHLMRAMELGVAEIAQQLCYYRVFINMESKIIIKH